MSRDLIFLLFIWHVRLSTSRRNAYGTHGSVSILIEDMMTSSKQTISCYYFYLLFFSFHYCSLGGSNIIMLIVKFMRLH